MEREGFCDVAMASITARRKMHSSTRGGRSHWKGRCGEGLIPDPRITRLQHRQHSQARRHAKYTKHDYSTSKDTGGEAVVPFTVSDSTGAAAFAIRAAHHLVH